MRAWIDVAVLAKTKNLDGRLVVRGTAGLPFLLEEGYEVSFVPPRTDLPRNAVVKSVREIDEFSAEVRFKGLDGDAARGLAGCHCLIRRDLIDESLFEEEPALWEGWLLVDAKIGEVGEVVGLLSNPGQDLLEVQRPSGEIALVPVVDEIVVDVNTAEKTVYANLPEGLLDL